MTAILKREIRAYFFTPLGYVFAGVFLAASGFVFYVNNILMRSGDFSGFFSMMGYLWMLLCPLLVMRLIAGERRFGTEPLLLSAPIGPWAVVLGKYLAAALVLFISALLSLFFPMLVSIIGNVHLPELVTGYLGFLLMGCAFIALNLLVSAFFSSPNTAMVFCLGGNLLLWLVSLLSVSAGPLGKWAISLVDLHGRATPFLYGQLSPANVVFFLAFVVSCLAGCVYVLHARSRGALV